MKVLIDTNILISAALFPGSVPYQAYMKAVAAPYHAMICDQNVDELIRIFNRKFPDRIHLLHTFLVTAMSALEIVSTPDEAEEVSEEEKVRDAKDRPIMRAAVQHGADVLLTGDKDFLESGIEHPECMTAATFLQLP